MKRKKLLAIIALIAAAVALCYLIVLVLCSSTEILPDETIEEQMFVKGYAFLPLPIVGLLAGILLQVFSVGKKNNQ